MMKGKKGALELSMTTIIVIVIGVVLLSLSLLFIRSLFGQINDLRVGIFREANIAVRDIGSSGKFSMPSSVQAKQGTKSTFPITISNDGSGGPGTKEYSIHLTPQGDFEQYVQVRVLPNKITLQEGKAADFTAQVAATTNAPLTLNVGYEVVVTCTGCSEQYASGGLFVEITESRSLFG